MAYNVFISYSTKDLGDVRRIVSVVRGTGAKAFIAEDDLRVGGETNSLLDRISESDLLLVCWSENARASEWVQQEAAFALGQDVDVAVVVIDDTKSVPGFLKGKKYEKYGDEDQFRDSLLIRQIEKDRATKQVLRGLLGVGVALLVLGRPMPTNAPEAVAGDGDVPDVSANDG